ncbi:MAG: hypothetical protein MJ072_02125 [Clostridia bacterium]|nr:hypothetical protein [Clostridia bacterium]
MICEKCRYEQDHDFEICPSCATPVKMAYKPGNTSGKAKTVQKKKKMSRKRKARLIRRVSVVAGVLVALIIILICIFSGGSGVKFEYPDHSAYMFTSSDGIPTFMFDESSAVPFEEGAISTYEISYSGKYAVVLTSRGALFLVDSKKVTKFENGDNVNRFKLAPFADMGVYSNNYLLGEGGTLSYSYLSDPSSFEVIAEKVIVDNSCDFVVSPGGKSFAYVSEMIGAAWTYKVIGKGSSSPKYVLTERRITVKAISDDMKSVYYTDEEGNFCLLSTGISTICSEFNLTGVIYNEDASEALVSYNDGANVYTELIRNGKVCSDERQLGKFEKIVLPDEIRSADSKYYCVDSFVNTLVKLYRSYNSSEEYYYISNKYGKFVYRLYGIAEIYISSDCKTVYFRKEQNGIIKYMKLSSDMPSEYTSKYEGEKINVADFKISKDGDYIYFIDNEGALYYQKNKTSAVKVCDRIYGREYYITDSGNVYFVKEYNGSTMELYFAKKGSTEPSKIKVGQQANSLSYYPSSDAVIFEADGIIYSASSGKGIAICAR